MAEDISNKQMTSVDLYLKKINKTKQDKIKGEERKKPSMLHF